jgi:hypothetical protein
MGGMYIIGELGQEELCEGEGLFPREGEGEGFHTKGLHREGESFHREGEGISLIM